VRPSRAIARASGSAGASPDQVSDTTAMNDKDLLSEQRAFYRARAPEYDEWWQRRGRYDRGDPETREWDRQVATVDAALASFAAVGNVLENGRRHRLVDRAACADCGCSHGGRCVARGPRPQSPPGGPTRRGLRHRRLVRLAPPADLRRGVLLVLALARAPRPLRCLLVAGAHLLGAGGAERSSSTTERTPRQR
jgi:hypothetical protein